VFSDFVKRVVAPEEREHREREEGGAPQSNGPRQAELHDRLPRLRLLGAQIVAVGRAVVLRPLTVGDGMARTYSRPMPCAENNAWPSRPAAPSTMTSVQMSVSRFIPIIDAPSWDR
jgi:hypothetical protein